MEWKTDALITYLTVCNDGLKTESILNNWNEIKEIYYKIKILGNNDK